MPVKAYRKIQNRWWADQPPNRRRGKWHQAQEQCLCLARLSVTILASFDPYNLLVLQTTREAKALIQSHSAGQWLGVMTVLLGEDQRVLFLESLPLHYLDIPSQLPVLPLNPAPSVQKHPASLSTLEHPVEGDRAHLPQPVGL